MINLCIMRIIRLLLLGSLLFIVFNSFSQGYKKKSKKDKPLIISLSGGVAGGDYDGISAMSPFLYLELRKTAIRLGRYFNFSYDFNVGPHVAIFKGQYIAGRAIAVYPAAQFTFNFNALAGATPPTKKQAIKIPVGFFLGPGVYMSAGTYGSIIGTLSGNIYDNTPKKMSIIDGGPMVNFGFRIKLSKRYYFGIRVYGAFTVANEVAIGGGSLVFPVNLGKYANAM